jgi:hypothetical protein
VLGGTVVIVWPLAAMRPYSIAVAPRTCRRYIRPRPQRS